MSSFFCLTAPLSIATTVGIIVLGVSSPPNPIFNVFVPLSMIMGGCDIFFFYGKCFLFVCLFFCLFFFFPVDKYVDSCVSVGIPNQIRTKGLLSKPMKGQKKDLRKGSGVAIQIPASDQIKNFIPQQ